MKGFLTRAVFIPLLSGGLLPLRAPGQEGLDQDPRMAPVSVPQPPELQAALSRAGDLASKGRVQAAVTLLESLVQKDPGRPFPLAPGWFLPLSQALNRSIPAMGEGLLEAWNLRTGPRARRLLEEGLSRRDKETLRRVADLFPATPARREALLALADLALEGSKPWVALVYLEKARRGASSGGKARALVREAFAWAVLGRETERDRALARLASLGIQAPLQGDRLPPSRLAQLPPFQVSLPPGNGISWTPRSAARLWLRSTPPPPQWNPGKSGISFFGIRGGGYILPSSGGSLEKLDARSSKALFFHGLFFIRRTEGLDILETATGRLRGLIRKTGATPPLDPRMSAPIRPSWALARRAPACEGDLVFFLHAARRKIQSRRIPLARYGVPQFGESLAAYRISTGNPAWSFDLSSLPPPLSKGWIQAGPAVTGGTVALLIQANRSFTLLGLESRSGKVRWTRPLHTGGTGFARPPAVPLLARDGVFFAPTGAGAVCAVEAGKGGILWLRAYPREDSTAPPPIPFHKRAGGWMIPSRGVPSIGFQVSRPLLAGGILVLAPPDGDYLLGISALDGRLLWRSSRRDPRIPKESPPLVDHLLGGDENLVYLAGRKLLAVETRSGRKIWEAEIPPVTGRGVVSRDSILLPTAKGVFFVEKVSPHSTGLLHLPGRPPGPMDLYLHAPYLAGITADHAVLWVQWRAWCAQAGDPLEKARRLALCGRFDDALETLESIPGGDRNPDLALWSLDLARRLLEESKKEEALQVLEKARRKVQDPLGRVSLLDLHFRVLLASGRNEEAHRTFMEFLDAALAVAKEGTR